MKNKKTIIIAISFLSLLLLVPFTKFSRAQVPSYVGVVEGQHEEWDANIYTGAWGQWNADNMTNRWAEAFGQTFLDNMSAVLGTAAKVPLLPQATMFYTIDDIIADTDGFDNNSDGGITPDEAWASPGNTLLNITGGTFMDFGGWPYWYYFANGAGIFIANTTAGFAEDTGYGAMYSSLIWATNMFNSGNYPWAGWQFDKNYTNTIFFAPNNVNWTEFADVCNLMLSWPIWLATGYSVKFSNVTDGFMMSSAVGDFVQNTENINVTSTYDSNGLLTYHKFEYGSDLLLDMALADSTIPVITVSPSDIINVDYDYTGLVLSWTATDDNPDEYAILQNGSAVVFPTAWSSGVGVQYDVPDWNVTGGLAPGYHEFQINFGDTRPNRPNVGSHTVLVVVGPAPVVTPPPFIPGYEPFAIIGIFTIASIVITIRMKKKK